MSHRVGLTLTAGAFTIATGREVKPSAWAAGFDHAALVAAGRSRADAYDFYLVHESYGTIDLVDVTGANTTNCKLGFNVPYDVGAFAVDAGFILIFGDLGWQVSRLVAAGNAAPGSPAVVAVVQAVSLPSPGFPLAETRVHDVRLIPYPDAAVVRTARMNENPRRRYAVAFANISPEDWYEVRAFHRGQAGGAASFTAPSWLNGGSGTFQIVPGSLTLTQASRRDYAATLEVEEVPV